MQQWTEADFKSAGTRLRGLEADHKPLWGKMSLQHMVEHLVGSWRISNGRARVKVLLDEQEVQRRRAFLDSDEPYPRNVQNPVFAGGLPPLRKPSVEAAIVQLEDEINAFFEHFSVHPDAIEVHPIFGPMDHDHWLRFQSRHMTHHFTQFGLMP